MSVLISPTDTQHGNVTFLHMDTMYFIHVGPHQALTSSLFSCTDFSVFAASILTKTAGGETFINRHKRSQRPQSSVENKLTIST